MRRAPQLLALLGLLLLTLAHTVEARGVTVYIQHVVIAQPGDLRLGDLMQSSGDTPLSAREVLAQDIATVSSHLLYIPSHSYMDRVGDAFGRDSIFVGSRSLVIPSAAVPDNEIPLLDRLVDFLGDAGVLGGDVTDIDVRSIQPGGTLSQTIVPSFQLVRTTQGSVEVSFTSSSDAGQTTGRIVLALKADGRASAADVHAHDPVRVIFHKGPITIEMQGRALAPAAIGDTVNVLVTDSQKSFAGRLVTGKAVDVELP